MFHVYVSDKSHHVFTEQDPRLDGYAGKVDENVTVAPPLSGHWPEGGMRPPIPVIARLDGERLEFREFTSEAEAKREGYEVVSGLGVRFRRWQDYVNSQSR